MKLLVVRLLLSVLCEKPAGRFQCLSVVLKLRLLSIGYNILVYAYVFNHV